MCFARKGATVWPAILLVEDIVILGSNSLLWSPSQFSCVGGSPASIPSAGSIFTPDADAISIACHRGFFERSSGRRSPSASTDCRTANLSVCVDAIVTTVVHIFQEESASHAEVASWGCRGRRGTVRSSTSSKYWSGRARYSCSDRGWCRSKLISLRPGLRARSSTRLWCDEAQMQMLSGSCWD
jgi:hypothetical protein